MDDYAAQSNSEEEYSLSLSLSLCLSVCLSQSVKSKASEDKTHASSGDNDTHKKESKDATESDTTAAGVEKRLNEDEKPSAQIASTDEMEAAKEDDKDHAVVPQEAVCPEVIEKDVPHAKDDGKTKPENGTETAATAATETPEDHESPCKKQKVTESKDHVPPINDQIQAVKAGNSQPVEVK